MKFTDGRRGGYWKIRGTRGSPVCSAGPLRRGLRQEPADGRQSRDALYGLDRDDEPRAHGQHARYDAGGRDGEGQRFGDDEAAQEEGRPPLATRSPPARRAAPRRSGSDGPALSPSP